MSMKKYMRESTVFKILIRVKMFKDHYTGHPSLIPKHLSSITTELKKEEEEEEEEKFRTSGNEPL